MHNRFILFFILIVRVIVFNKRGHLIAPLIELGE
jgi:hypothetical protein